MFRRKADRINDAKGEEAGTLASEESDLSTVNYEMWICLTKETKQLKKKLREREETFFFSPYVLIFIKLILLQRLFVCPNERSLWEPYVVPLFAERERRETDTLCCLKKLIIFVQFRLFIRGICVLSSVSSVRGRDVNWAVCFQMAQPIRKVN